MQAAANPRTLIDAIVPLYRPDDRVYAIARDIAIMVGFALFVSLCAQIAIRLPWTPVPITGQTFAVLGDGRGVGRVARRRVARHLHADGERMLARVRAGR